MNHEEFLKARQTGIGGSDIATLLGVNPYCTKLELYLQKRGELEPNPDTSLTKAGRIMENVIASMVSERTNRKLRRINQTLRHPKYDFLIAHIDRDFVGHRKGLEIKNVSPRMGYLWGKDGETDGVAEYYIPQAHHYMLVMDYPAFEVAAYFGGDDLRLYPIERDKEMDEIIIETAHDFWHKHVLAGVPPEPEYDHPKSLPLFKRLYPGTNGKEIEANEEIQHWAAVLQDATKHKSNYAKVENLAKAHILEFMKDAAILKLDNDKTFRRKQVKKSGHFVEPTTYIDARFSALRGQSDE